MVVPEKVPTGKAMFKRGKGWNVLNQWGGRVRHPFLVEAREKKTRNKRRQVIQGKEEKENAHHREKEELRTKHAKLLYRSVLSDGGNGSGKSQREFA